MSERKRSWPELLYPIQKGQCLAASKDGAPLTLGDLAKILEKFPYLKSIPLYVPEEDLQKPVKLLIFNPDPEANPWIEVIGFPEGDPL